jgi:leucyl aminopeptidase
MSTMLSFPIHLLNAAEASAQASRWPWLATSLFRGLPHTVCLIPDSSGGLGAVACGRGNAIDTWTLGHLPARLSPGRYHLADSLPPEQATLALLGWELACYRFDRYRTPAASPSAPAFPELVPPAGADTAFVRAAVTAIHWARDLINTPANDMGPDHLEQEARSLAVRHMAQIGVIRGDDLLAAGYPLIHAVGRASAVPPRLVDLRWTGGTGLKVTLVGKGVCFDTGGLNIKSSAYMRPMKKDMGGAAQVLALASLIMAMQLPVTLRVLLPMVENSIAGNAMRPSDVLPTRKGVTVEVGDTDAEGRLILADALWEASQERPDLLIDCATLTGAARVALGTDLPALFANDDRLAGELLAAARTTDDPLWQLPLHDGYRAQLNSKIADLCNIGSGAHGGAILAALFLREFVGTGIPWAHLDLMAWRQKDLPGRPEGGDVMGLLALYKVIREKAEGSYAHGQRP